jgi:hypothetical protein
VNPLVLVVDDEPDVEILFRQQFRRDLRIDRFTMEFVQPAPMALQRITDAGDRSLILILSDINTGITREAHLICGRRAGKSFVLALIAVFLAAFVDWRGCFSPGERGTIMVIAADRKQARVIFRYIYALITKVPMLAGLIERSGAEYVDLSNSVTIEIQTASFRTTRGYTMIAALLDELAFWRSEESANPDTLRPAMATVPGSMLLCASSPSLARSTWPFKLGEQQFAAT